MPKYTSQRAYGLDSVQDASVYRAYVQQHPNSQIGVEITGIKDSVSQIRKNYDDLLDRLATNQLNRRQLEEMLREPGNGNAIVEMEGHIDAIRSTLIGFAEGQGTAIAARAELTSTLPTFTDLADYRTTFASITRILGK